jgi:hypothetical protein
MCHESHVPHLPRALAVKYGAYRFRSEFLSEGLEKYVSFDAMTQQKMIHTD